MVNRKGPDVDAGTLAAANAALEKLEHRREGDFDGLLGEFPDEKSIVLRDIAYRMRNYLLDRHDEDTVRRLLVAQYPDDRERGGLQWGPSCTEADDLALEVLGLIGSAFKVDAERMHILISGKDGWSGAKSRVGGAKGRDTQKGQAGSSVIVDQILDLARRDTVRKRGWKAHIAKEAECTPQYVGQIIKQNRK